MALRLVDGAGLASCGAERLLPGLGVVVCDPAADRSWLGDRGVVGTTTRFRANVDIDLQLARRDQPGTSRRPDLVVVERGALQRVRTEGGLLLAAETVLVVEIVSPGSRRTAFIVKRSEYADAGIPHYWIVDLEPAGAVSLRACHQSEGTAGYVDDGAVAGTYTTDLPFPFTVDLAAISDLLR